jgi:hypothetical protein
LRYNKESLFLSAAAPRSAKMSEQMTRARLLSSWSRRWEADEKFRDRMKEYYVARYSRETAKRQRWAYQTLVKKGKIKSPSAETLLRHGLTEWFEEWKSTTSSSSSAGSGTTPSAALDL